VSEIGPYRSGLVEPGELRSVMRENLRYITP
jgi:hypothetical protein